MARARGAGRTSTTSVTPAPDGSGEVSFDLVTVKNTSGPRVGFYERHPDHPNGEAKVFGDKPVQVAETRLLLRALSQGRIAYADPKTGKELRQVVEPEDTNPAPDPPAEPPAGAGAGETGGAGGDDGDDDEINTRA